MGFSFSRSLTIDHTKCGSSPSSSFPVLASATHATLKDVANGGHVQSSTGADILFFSDAALTTQIASEIDFYDNVNGVLAAWVQVATVSNTVDTVIYIAYGNASPPARTTNPWDANFKGVWHMGEASGNFADSTTNANTGVNSSVTQGATGKWGKCATYNGTTSQTLCGTGASLAITAALTAEAWFNISSFASPVPKRSIIEKGYNGTVTGYAVGWNYDVANDNKLEVIAYPGGATVRGAKSTTATIAGDVGVWHHVAGVYTGTAWKIYLDGVDVTAALNVAVAPQASGARFTMGCEDVNGVISQFFAGSIQEGRVSNTNRSVDWILTEFNNQNAPGTIGTPGFLTWGAETTLGSQQQFSMLGCGS